MNMVISIHMRTNADAEPSQVCPGCFVPTMDIGKAFGIAIACGLDWFKCRMPVTPGRKRRERPISTAFSCKRERRGSGDELEGSRTIIDGHSALFMPASAGKRSLEAWVVEIVIQPRS